MTNPKRKTKVMLLVLCCLLIVNRGTKTNRREQKRQGRKTRRADESRAGKKSCKLVEVLHRLQNNLNNDYRWRLLAMNSRSILLLNESVASVEITSRDPRSEAILLESYRFSFPTGTRQNSEQFQHSGGCSAEFLERCDRTHLIVS